MHFKSRPYTIAFALLLWGTVASRGADMELVGPVQKIWDAGKHNAFTDLIRFRDEWFCVFREGTAHVSPDGALRVIRSTDGDTWQSAACLTNAGDLRDAKISLTPTGELMLLGAAAFRQPPPTRHVSLVWFSKNGREWSEPAVVGETNFWLWRVSWHKQIAYGVGYETTTEKSTRLYRSADGRKYDILVPRLFDQGMPNESAIVFKPDDTALCLLRRDGSQNTGLLGVSRPPYTEWAWKDLGTRIGGPHMIRLPDGRLLAAVRLYDGTVRTSLAWIDEETGKLREGLRLPSGGDTSYAGLIWDGTTGVEETAARPNLWVSYYSSHEGKTSIYLARVRVR